MVTGQEQSIRGLRISMGIDVQFRINSDPRMLMFLKENSYWYKYLNRSDMYFKDFFEDMKDKYELKPTDKINRLLDNINMFGSFLEALK